MDLDLLTKKLADSITSTSNIDSHLFKDYGVKRGLRNEDGSGVLVGLTNIGNVVGYDRQGDGSLKPIDGKLFYRGYELKDLVSPLVEQGRFGFEEVAYLLLSGELPNKGELESFQHLLNSKMALDHRSLVHIIDLEGSNIMNILARCVLEMYTFDPSPDDISKENLMRQSIDLIAKFPTIIAYAYNCYRHSQKGKGLHIRHPQENMSIAENFLYMLKNDGFSPLDAQMLDLLMITQAEHGGGNNSTFAVRVTSSSRTDTYSSIAAGIGSLKGSLHGGANIMVSDMFTHLRETIKNWDDNQEIDNYLMKMLAKKAYDGSGLIYGLGHAVYTLSDPRAVALKELAGKLAIEKGRTKEYEFLCRIEERGKECISRAHNRNRPVCANLDFYSGFIYEMIGIPRAIYTPIFAMSRIVGWCSHRNEELTFNDRRIIRPAYMNVQGERDYVRLEER